MTPPITVFTILKLNINFFTTLPNLYNFYRNCLKWLLVVFTNFVEIIVSMSKVPEKFKSPPSVQKMYCKGTFTI